VEAKHHRSIFWAVFKIGEMASWGLNDTAFHLREYYVPTGH
jgi:hypothetical protein